MIFLVPKVGCEKKEGWFYGQFVGWKIRFSYFDSSFDKVKATEQFWRYGIF